MNIVRTETRGEIALVIIDNPPVNALSLCVRRALYDAIAKIEAGPARAAILFCKGKTFSVGADIGEFDKLRESPTLPEIILALEASKKTWCAALFGTALGGGLELALGCDYRIASADTQFGFPEVLIGTIPGAGGTQRAPRLIGIDAALDLIASGKRIAAKEALDLGLVDHLAADNLRGEAISYLLAHLDKPKKIDPAPVTACGHEEEKRKALLARARGQIAPIEAMNAVLLAAKLPLYEGLREERVIFERLAAGPQSRAMRYQFFAEREAVKIPELETVSALPLKKIGVVGGGTMGCGIAVACTLAGFETVLVEKNSDSLNQAHARLHEIIAEMEKRGHSIRKEKLNFSEKMQAVSSCDLVIEAVFEDLQVKKDILAQLGKILKPDSLIATNTSYLDVDELAQASGRPENFLGLHFFAPAHVMKLLEIVRGKQTSRQVLATGFAFARALKKIGVLANAAEGFIGNRIWQAYRSELEFMLEEGASPYEIDSAMEAYGFVLGPFKVADLSGLDIAWMLRKRKPKRERYVEIPDLLCESGRFGRKTNAGWYDYEQGKPTPSAFVENLIARERERKKLMPRAFDAGEIRERALAAIVAEAKKLLEEGVARHPRDIDVVMVNGYGWPRWRGGPLFESNADKL